MTDYRIGFVEGAEVSSTSVSLFSRPLAAGGRRTKSRTVRIPEVAVIDAGFDAFMRDNFSRVVAGEKIEFHFAVPGLRRFFKFQLDPSGETLHRGELAYMVKMKPASALLRIAVDPIELVYSKGGRLLEFRGLSNICDEQGDRYKARIVFEYPHEHMVDESPQIAQFGRVEEAFLEDGK
jgi:hypothetical protein